MSRRTLTPLLFAGLVGLAACGSSSTTPANQPKANTATTAAMKDKAMTETTDAMKDKATTTAKP